MAAQRWARAAGVLLLISVVAGMLGEMIIPSKIIVAGDAVATAANLRDREPLFRFGFAAYLCEATCDITLSLIFYLLLRPVNNGLSLLAAFFGLVATAVFAGAEFFYFGASIFTGNAADLNAFSPAQRDAFAMLSLRAYVVGGAIFLLFYGIASIVRGYLIYRSTYLPRILGILLMIGGAGFVVRNFAEVLAPRYASSLFLLPMAIAGLPLLAWLLIRGVDVAKWEAAQ